ncbi:MAG: GNAT family N-acetyltransferase [Anaerolineales bacterium]|nr:GNAT family N-acetyltransferase [Anaerolineales bacterium]
MIQHDTTVDREELQMMEIKYRPARPEDVPEMADLFLEAVSNMYARNNITAVLPPRPAVLLGYEHVRATGIFHVAELEGRIAAIAGAIVRDHLWYLSAFWARPDLQRQGIGMPLLKAVWTAGQVAGATVFFTWSSVDSAAMASYMKLGMVPGYPILLFEGMPQKLPPVASTYEVVTLEKSQAVALDQEIRATGRGADHDFWRDGWGLQGRQVILAGEVIGYYYLGKGGIGPVAWREPQDGQAVLALACNEATAMTPHIRFAVPGINHSALRFAFDSGLRLTSFAHFLTSASFGRMDQYLPQGPGLY